MNNTNENPIVYGVAPLVGRILLGVLFLMAGIGKISGWEGTAGYMASVGMPFVPLFLFGAIVLEVGGGLSLLLGLKARLGGLLLAMFLVPTTLIFHAFWNLEGQERYMQMLMFNKNLAIIGGLLYVAVFGAGKFSLDNLVCPLRKKK
ncbi:MAG TPA: DoxX family protein [Myxococcota bacterium]|nr:DoxX family protein [Myxococcota bacterium]HOA13475.1 DoxX family protein [Myxococcota bacterium]HOH76825.1 DoxX family protein [Myxococcota bacterium]HPV05070.1 DoxX family protein [Myxococcota bacterium]